MLTYTNNRLEITQGTKVDYITIFDKTGNLVLNTHMVEKNFVYKYEGNSLLIVVLKLRGNLLKVFRLDPTEEIRFCFN